MKKIMALLAALTVVLAACGGGGTDSDGAAPSAEPVSDPVITIADMEFQGGDVTVEAGTTVTWVWKDAPTEHNVNGDGFESPLQAEGTFTHTFDEVGTYDYVCDPHSGTMTGTITVVEPSDGSAAS